MSGALDALGWTIVVLLGLGAAVGSRQETGRPQELARAVAVGGWVLFGAFWLALAPHFWLAKSSPVEAVLALVAAPACLRAGWLLWRGRDSVFELSRALAVMGLLYLPFQTFGAVDLFGVGIPAPQAVVVGGTATVLHAVVTGLGYEAVVVVGETGYRDTLLFVATGGGGLRVQVLTACTSVGTMAVFVGVVATAEASLAKRLRVLAVVLTSVYLLNVVRLVVVAVAFGEQALQLFVDEVLMLFGASDPRTVSFLVADKLVAQPLAVLAVAGLSVYVVRRLPATATLFEEVLVALTGRERDLRARLAAA